MGYVHWGAQSTPRIVSIALATDEAAIQRLLVDDRKQLVLVTHQVVVLTEVGKYRWAVNERFPSEVEPKTLFMGHEISSFMSQ